MLYLAVIVLLIFILGTLYLIFHSFHQWVGTKAYLWLIVLMVSASVFGAFAFGIYTALYPLDSFYFDEFETITLLKAPKSADVIDKSASYPDIHGDYTSCSIMELSKEDYNALLSALSGDKKLLTNPELVESEELDAVMKDRKITDIRRSFSRANLAEDHYTYIGFFADGKSILVYMVNS